MSTSTRATVDELLRRLAEGDPDRVSALYAAGCDWKLSWPDAEHGRASTPWLRHRSARADARYLELTGHHVHQLVGTEVEHIIVSGNDAVVLGEIRPTRRACRTRFALHLTVEGGLITRHHLYEDSLAAALAPA